MATQTYLDYRTPAIEAGAVEDKAYWYMQSAEAGNQGYYSLESLCHDNGIEPTRQAPPRTRSMAAIRKSYGKPETGGSLRTGMKQTAMRASAYLRTMRGEEVPHSACQMGSIESEHRRYEVTAAGEKRLRSICVGKEWVEIPHWDFTPIVIELEI